MGDCREGPFSMTSPPSEEPFESAASIARASADEGAASTPMYSQPSPSSVFLSGLPIKLPPDFLPGAMDSESSSRSSFDSSLARGEDGRWEGQPRSSRRSSSSSSSEDNGSAGFDVESTDWDENPRKQSKSKEETLPVVGLHTPRGRVANIRRESSCGNETEVAHERLVKTTQQVSTGFDEFRLDTTRPTNLEERQSLTEPISILTTNIFLPHSCTPSPTCQHDNKVIQWKSQIPFQQCYSPSTQQIVRSNIPYSASPSPTQSPNRSRLLRSESPILRPGLKRRYPSSIGGFESDGEPKRVCLPLSRNSSSPLACDRPFAYPATINDPPTPQSTCSTNSAENFEAPCIPARRLQLQGELRRVSTESFPEEPRSTDDLESMSDSTSEPSSVKTATPMETPSSSSASN